MKNILDRAYGGKGTIPVWFVSGEHTRNKAC